MDDLRQTLSETMEGLKEKLPERSDEIDVFKTAQIMANFSRDRFRQSGDKEDLDVTVTLQEFVHNSRPPDHPDRRITSYNLSLLLYRRYQVYEGADDLEKAIATGREAVDLCPKDHPDRPRIVGNLASFLLTRFDKAENDKDLDEMISLRRTAVELRPHGHPDRCMALNNLANSLSARSNRNGGGDDLDELISLRRAVLDLRPEGHPSRSGSLGCLAISLLTRFRRSGNVEDLKESISLYRATLDLLPEDNANRPGALSSLADAIFRRFETLGISEDLDEAVTLYRSALVLRPVGHPKHFLALLNLSRPLMSRFSLNGKEEDLDEAVSLYRMALSTCPEAHPDHAMLINNLANALLTRFDRNGNTEELDESIVLYRTALDFHPDGHPDRSMSLLNLANALLTRFEQGGEGLEESITLYQETLQLRPIGHPERFSSLNNLANSLLNRFWQTGCGEDLDESISLFRAALDLLPDCHQERSTTLSNLAVSLLSRFQQNRSDEDVNEAISFFRTSLELRPNGHPARFASLTNLASSLLDRFELKKSDADLEEATSLQRTCLKLVHVGHPEYPKLLNNLGSSLLRSFEFTGKSDALDEAISITRAALDIYPDNHPFYPMVMNNVASSLLFRFRQSNTYNDLDESISLLRAVLDLLPNDHPDRIRSLFDLAACFHNKLEKNGHVDDLENAIEYLRQAASSKFSSCLVRLKAVQRWASLARSQCHHTTLVAYRNAISLLQRSLTVRATLPAQCDLLGSDRAFRTLATDAASYAIEIGDLPSAIELLEQGRAMLWSEMRGIKAPLVRLAEENQSLASRFENVVRRLESLITFSETRYLDSNVGADGKKGMGKEHLRDRMLMRMRQLSQEQDALTAEIQKFSGFEDFLQMPSFKILQGAASEGPVILINHSRFRCDALIISANTDVPCTCVPLDKDWWKDSLTLWGDFLQTRIDHGEHSLVYDEVLQRVMRVVWDRVASKVVWKLKDIGVREGSRIWWCPTSILSSFPFHAAGPYQPTNGGIKYLLDDYVSSYTPTLMALVNARTDLRMGSERFLFVGDTKLRSTRKERDVIRKHRQIRKCLEDKDASRDAVLKAMKKAEWVHFACHGRLVTEEPFRSSFALPASELTLLDIAKARIPNAEFAFLSACHTAEQPPTPALDEVLHLAAGIQFCGFRSVIGTMWKLLDRDGPVLADAVYTYLKRDIAEDDFRFKMSAAAVREAALHRRHRKEDGEDGQDVCVMTERWVNLIHIGA